MGVLAPFLILLSLVMIDSAFAVRPEATNRLFEIGFPFAGLLWGTVGFWLGAWCFLDRMET